MKIKMFLISLLVLSLFLLFGSWLQLVSWCVLRYRNEPDLNLRNKTQVRCLYDLKLMLE